MSLYLRIDDTIAAIATAPGGAARGIVRVSGPDAIACVAGRFTAARGVALVDLRQPTVLEGSLVVDGFCSPASCLLYVWPSRRSYTRQPMVEVHAVGSPPLLQAILGTVCRDGARPALPGEFTMRAFLAGRLDLTQAEAVLGVIDARDGRELNRALEQLAGGLSARLGEVRGALLDLLADVEAGLDFVDEEIEFITRNEIDARLADAIARIAAVAEALESRGDAGDLPRCVLVGPPNAGKSSLFNALLGRPAALVADAPGTTRDYLTARLDLGGAACELIDTAGEDREAEPGSIADLAESQRRDQAEESRIEILCVDSSQPCGGPAESIAANSGATRIVALTKVDRPLRQSGPPGAIATSAETGEGLDLLRERIRLAVVDLSHDDGGAVAATAARSAESLRSARSALNEARRLAAGGEGEELVAAELRLALDEIGRIVGAVYTDDVLDRIFSRFCIGK